MMLLLLLPRLLYKRIDLCVYIDILYRVQDFSICSMCTAVLAFGVCFKKFLLDEIFVNFFLQNESRL